MPSSTVCSTTGWTCVTSPAGPETSRSRWPSPWSSGPPPSFEGVVCVDCGNRFRTEFDHVKPHGAKGPASNGNLKPRCWSCHRAKTLRDRRAGKLTPPEP
jgi:5-methylcytosine-specific restriction endonuclease McrA